MIKFLVQGGNLYYTFLSTIFQILDLEKDYNWLVCDYECTSYANEYIYNRRSEFVLLTNDEIINYFVNDDPQFIWGAILAFDKKIKIKDILSYEIPVSQIDIEEKKFYQHPLSEFEIVSQDSSCFYLMLKDKQILNDYIYKLNANITVFTDDE